MKQLPSHLAAKAAYALCAALALAACAKKSQVPKDGIDAWRARATDSDDAGDWTMLTAHELLGDGGDPQAVAVSLARAEQLGGKTLRSLLLGAELHVLHGEPEQAFERWLELLELAAARADAAEDAPLAAWSAELALQAVRDMRSTVPDYTPRVSQLLEQHGAAISRLGPMVAHELFLLRHERAQRAGDARRAEAVWREAGCVQEARVAGPFGPREMLGFDRELPAEQPGPLQDHYDLEPRRPQVATRTVSSRQCVLGLGRGVLHPQGGSHVARAEVQVDEPGRHVLRVETPNSFVAWLDDELLAKVDRRHHTGAATQLFERELSAGTHSVRLKVTSRHPNPSVRLTLRPAGDQALTGVALPEPHDPLLHYVAAKLALGRSDVVRARELSPAAGAEAPTASTLVLQAAIALADPLRDGELRRDAARTALKRASGRDSQAWYPRLALANLEAAEGRLLESLDGLRAARKRWPEVLAIHLSLVQRLNQRRFHEAADAALREAVERFPSSCALTLEQLESEQRRERAGRIEPLVDAAMQCDATLMARFEWLKARGDRAAAAEELERLLNLADLPYGSQQINSEIDLASLRGETARERELRMQRAERFPTHPNFVLDRADLLLADESREAARDYLATAIATEPDALYELRSAHEALGGEDAFADFRLDGDAVLEAFASFADQYTQPQVLVLDYTVMRLMPDGSSLDLTHNILRVQSQEAVDALGEWEPPEGARVLKLRTIKADGRKLEPDVISGKDSFSLPNLSPGDYVEYEFVRAASPSEGFPRGYVADRFYFKSFEVPFHRSELVMVLPPDVEAQVERRGDAPTTQRESHEGQQVLRFVAEQSLPLEPEPGSVPMKEYVPSVLVGYEAGWDDYIESLRDLLSDKSPYDPAAEDHVRSLLEGTGQASTHERVAVLHRWVTEEIAPTDELFGMAPAMWASRTGSRDRILAYLLSLAGIESELVMVRSRTGDHAEPTLPDAGTYGYLLLRVQTEEGPLWVSTAQRGAAVDFVPEILRGEPGLVLNSEAERVKVPAGEPLSELHTVALTVRPQAGGSGTVEVIETLRGAHAISWREDLRSIADAELEARFESGYVAQRFAGGQLVDLEIEGLRAPGAPLVLRYTVEQPNLMRAEGDTLSLSGLFPNALAMRYAQLAERTTTLVVASSDDVDVSVEVVAPEGVAVTGLPASLEIDGPRGARFTSRAERTPQGAIVTRTLRLPSMRVPASRYDEFATFCRAVDVAEASELSLHVK